MKSGKQVYGRPTKVLSKEQLLTAMQKTLSNAAAARYLHVSYPHYKKYAKLYKDEETGKTLFEVHKNSSGKGIPKMTARGPGFSIKNLKKVVKGKAPIYSWTPRTLKVRLIQSGLLEEKCCRCGFSERRVVDSKVPLVLHFKDGNKTNWLLKNLGFLCYNCYFLYVEDIFTRKQVDALEDYREGIHKEEVDWEVSKEMLEHFGELGLLEDPTEDEAEYIDYL